MKSAHDIEGLEGRLGMERNEAASHGGAPFPMGVSAPVVQTNTAITAEEFDVWFAALIAWFAPCRLGILTGFVDIDHRATCWKSSRISWRAFSTVPSE